MIHVWFWRRELRLASVVAVSAVAAAATVAPASVPAPAPASAPACCFLLPLLSPPPLLSNVLEPPPLSLPAPALITSLLLSLLPL